MRLTQLKHTMAGFFALLASAVVLPVQAYDVESDTTANRIYMLLINDNPGAVFHTITIDETVPSFVNSVSAAIVPASVNGGSSDLAALDFGVASSASIGATGTINITVSGFAAGVPVDVNFSVPLEVVNSAAAAQGFVGTGEPTPDPGGVDTDGDGVPDSIEIAYGSDPNIAGSVPGTPDTDGDGLDDGADPAPADPCNPSVFNAVCTTDTDGDGETDGNEGEFTDTDADGTPDYQESSITDDDGDGVANELDPANGDPCVPDPMATNCTATEANVPVFGLPGYLILGLLLAAMGIKRTARHETLHSSKGEH